ncbi:glucarate dehydratase [Paenarthrobacter nitroguajacolicus]|uniref:enolase C-terminal domain-like protein n=1 Tax=Paenarthrobacter nitroguajacolicus TaxID=211146 RepID=UPI0015BF2B2B|nr:enolase C-terminal domain-like protein [Paenarthrobacter nitroguajacolicus]NWL10328.1 glucarate dehydratase [Paenarthrobacter nitroguajacolicus]
MANPNFTVTRVTITPILIQDAPLLNLQGVHQPYTPRVVVKVETQGGEYGVGETYGDTEIIEYLKVFSEQLLGLGVDQSQSLWQVARKTLTGEAIRTIDPGLVSGKLSRQVTGDNTLVKVHNTAVSVFEVAFLDALGKLTGLPVHTFLGGKIRDKVDFAAYLFWRFADHGDPGLPTDDWGAALDVPGIVAQAERFVRDYGFKSIKLKGGYHPPEIEAEAIIAVKQRFPDHPVRLDPNGIWSAETGTRIAKELDGVVEYLEDPTMGLQGMAEVHRATGVQLATNMCVTSMDQIPEAVSLGSTQVILCDHHYWGGLRATQHLSRICQSFGMGLSMHSNTHLGVSLAAMLHGAGAAEGDLHACDTHRPWQREDIITISHTFVDGALTVPDDPGLGVELDEDAVARLHQRWLDMPEMRIRDDVAAMRKFQPGWRKPVAPRW